MMTKEAIVLDDERAEVLVAGKRVHFPPKEYRILQMLLEADGKVISREAIISKLYQENAPRIDSRTIDQHVARLRGKLKTYAGSILTVPLRGYRFIKA